MRPNPSIYENVVQGEMEFTEAIKHKSDGQGEEDYVQ